MGVGTVSEDEWRKTYQSQPILDFKYPWEIGPVAEWATTSEDVPDMKLPDPLAEYIAFMDSHVRVRTFKDGVQLGTFSVTTGEGTDLGAEISLQNGATYKIVVVGHPVTTDPIMTPEELANYLLTC